MNWFSTIVRVAGTQFPFTSALVQFQAELDSDALLSRLQRLEDPISVLHQDVPAVSKVMYEAIARQNESSLDFDDDFYRTFSRSLAALHSASHIVLSRAMGRQIPVGLRVTDPSYILYLAARFADSDRMALLVNALDECSIGQSIDGHLLHGQLSLPIPVIRACFEIFEAKGFGSCSKSIGRVLYCGKA